jgi:hypothetical protein
MPVLRIGLMRSRVEFEAVGARKGIFTANIRKYGGILYPEFLARLAKYLCQRLTVLQESCKMEKFLKYNKLTTSVVKIYLNTSIARRCQAFVRLKNRLIFFNRIFLSLITPRISGGSRNMH